MVGGNNVLRLYTRIDVLTNGDDLERARQSAVYIDEGCISRVLQVTREPLEPAPTLFLTATCSDANLSSSGAR